MANQNFNRILTENEIKSKVTEFDRAFVICNGLTGFIFGGCSSFILLLLFNPHSQEFLKIYPFLCLLIISIIVAMAVQVQSGIPSGEVRKMTVLNTLTMSCLSMTSFLLVSYALSRNGLGFPTEKIDLTFVSAMPWLGGVWYSCMIGSSIGYFIWLGGKYALFGCVNLALIHFIIGGASNPTQAFQYMLGLVICQFLSGVLILRFLFKDAACEGDGACGE
jgi:hypothetical protein